MEIIVTDERDERFIEFCKSFGCVLDEPQVVLLLVNYTSTVGCASFKVYDADSIEEMINWPVEYVTFVKNEGKEV